MVRHAALVFVASLIAVTAGARELTWVYVVPAAANTAGKLGTDWHTDLTLYNPHSTSLPIVLHFLPNGRDNRGSVPTVEFEVYPWETLNLWDVLGPTVFDARGKIGALLIYADDTEMSCAATACDFVVFARTYTLDPGGGAGEYGQASPGFPADLGLDGSVIAYLPQLIEDGSFRTNLGVASWTDDWVTVRVDLQDAGGGVLQRRDHLVPPYGHVQWHLDRNVAGGTAAVYIVDGPADAVVYPYAAVANNDSGDSVYVEASLTPVGLSAQSAEPRELHHLPARPRREEVPGFDERSLRRPRR